MEITSLTENLDLALISKIVILFLLALYAVFVIITVTSIRSLNRLVIIQKALGSPLIQTIAIGYLLATISLFIAALVIL